MLKFSGNSYFCSKRSLIRRTCLLVETTRKIKIDTLTGQSPGAAGGGGELRSRTNRHGISGLPESSYDVSACGYNSETRKRIEYLRHQIPWRTSEKVVALRSGERERAQERKACGRHYWKVLRRTTATNGRAIRLSPIKYYGSVQNISVVFRIFLWRSPRWRLPLKRRERENNARLDASQNRAAW